MASHLYTTEQTWWL